jgi:acetoin utilization deacetylase AcuC-like enzyme
VKTFFHPDQLRHAPIGYFSRGKMRPVQEIPERALRLLNAARSMGFAVHEPQDYGLEPLVAVHSRDYLEFLRTAHDQWQGVPEDWGDEVMSNIHVRHPNALRGILAQAGFYLADGSCPIGAGTWTGAYASAQSAVAGARDIISGARRAWSLCRPPGHHARRDAAGGFCYLNNAAIAAELLSAQFGRVAILDTDMHHGQGVQEIFYRRRDVLYASVHGDPTNFYPATAGFSEERGEGAGVGCNLNLPMPHGASEADFFLRVDEAIDAVRAFTPPVLVLALGFDIYREDPQARVAVTTEGFGTLGAKIAQLNVPVLVVQEGGYHVESLEANARSFFAGLG